MSSGLMKTEKGGEQTQYESAHTFSEPHSKSGGQLGSASTSVDVNAEEEAKRGAERGEKTAENVRYGQAISEGGMSGFTGEGEGEAKQEGFGRQSDVKDDEEAAGRAAQGYGGSDGVSDEVGA